MNKRIRELAKKSRAIINEGFDGTKNFVYGITMSPEGLEKFAELLVQECMTQIQQVREIKAGHAGPEYTQGFDDGMFVAISTIEEHFGVEEK